MLRDAHSLEAGSTLEAEVCVVGAGPAGITLALELQAAGRRVVLLAGGDTEPQAVHRALADGISTGAPYFPLDGCRVRAFGGTTHTWGGWSRPMDASDFMVRDWVPDSGWPFPLETLADDFATAHRHCGLGPVNFDPAAWPRPAGPPLRGVSGTDLQEILFQVAPVRFGATHLPALRDTSHVTVLLNAHATAVTMAEDGCTATGVQCANTAGTRFSVRARAVVLAAGGIENPRLLLASPGQGSAGIGNARGLVGRYFGDHLHVPVGEIAIDTPATAAFFQPYMAGVHRVRGGLALTEAARRTHRLLGSAITLHNADDPHDLLSPPRWKGGYESMMTLARAALRGRLPDSPGRHATRMLRHLDEAVLLASKKVKRPVARRLRIGLRAEQAPCAESRVRLSHEPDRFGVPKAELHWKVSEADLASIETTQRLVAAALGAERVTLYPREGRGSWTERLQPGAHHMGTTRMHDDPARGVVDAWGRVHGTGNLFVAGSSVFPTGGWVPPTLTIVAVAVRVSRGLLQSIR